ncbi:MAG TPA: type II toxin-antitoxin system prevent-host-death family antitoxin [Candidatus Limnocylindrales bacterium]|nr:type II toxin-antitoxin system prevent-host-death family antitoxin [Candidatus Limnocylindrales bacterium]
MASRFKAECLAVLDQVEQLKVSVTITKHGRPIARLVPLESEQGSAPTMGSVRLVAEDDAAYYGTGEAWDAEGTKP